MASCSRAITPSPTSHSCCTSTPRAPRSDRRALAQRDETSEPTGLILEPGAPPVVLLGLAALVVPALDVEHDVAKSGLAQRFVQLGKRPHPPVVEERVAHHAPAAEAE